MATVLPMSDPTVAALNFAALMNQLAQFKSRQTENEINKIRLQHTQQGIMATFAGQKADREAKEARTAYDNAITKTANLSRGPTIERLKAEVGKTVQQTATSKDAGAASRFQLKRGNQLLEHELSAARGALNVQDAKIAASNASVRRSDSDIHMNNMKLYQMLGTAFATNTANGTDADFDEFLESIGAQNPAVSSASTRTEADVAVTTGGSPDDSQGDVPVDTGTVHGAATVVANEKSLGQLVAEAAFTSQMNSEDRRIRSEKIKLHRDRVEQIYLTAESDTAMDLILNDQGLKDAAYKVRVFGRPRNKVEDQPRSLRIINRMALKKGEYQQLTRFPSLTETQLRQSIQNDKLALGRFTKDRDKITAQDSIDANQAKLDVLDSIAGDLASLAVELADIPWIHAYQGTNYGPDYDGPEPLPGRRNSPRANPVQNITTPPTGSTVDAAPQDTAAVLATSNSQGTASQQLYTQFLKKPLTDFDINEKVRTWGEIPKEDWIKMRSDALLANIGSGELKIHINALLDRRTEEQVNAALDAQTTGAWPVRGGQWERATKSHSMAIVTDGEVEIVSKKLHAKKQKDKALLQIIEAEKVLALIRSRERSERSRKNRKKPPPQRVARRETSPISPYTGGGS